MICICCGEPMEPGSERPPSGGNLNQCVPCVYNLEFPASGSTLRKADGSAINFEGDWNQDIQIKSPQVARSIQTNDPPGLTTFRQPVAGSNPATLTNLPVPALAEMREHQASGGAQIPSDRSALKRTTLAIADARKDDHSAGNPFPNGRWT